MSFELQMHFYISISAETGADLLPMSFSYAFGSIDTYKAVYFCVKMSTGRRDCSSIPMLNEPFPPLRRAGAPFQIISNQLKNQIIP